MTTSTGPGDSDTTRERADNQIGWSEFFDSSVIGTGESSVPFLSVAHAVASHARTVAEIGCGRGGWSELSDNPVPLQDFRGPGRTVIGIDIDPVGIDNPMVDEFRLIDDVQRWPLDDVSVDVAVCDWTLEHVTDPTSFVAELYRVLRPGGVFVARTVSRYSPLSVGARTIPNERHSAVLAVLQPGRDAKDIFPTEYRMNSDRAVQDLFSGHFDLAISHQSDLSMYFQRWPRTARFIAATEPHLPRAVRSTMVIYARKRRKTT